MNVHEAIEQKRSRIVENDLHQSFVLGHRLSYYSKKQLRKILIQTFMVLERKFGIFRVESYS